MNTEQYENSFRQIAYKLMTQYHMWPDYDMFQDLIQEMRITVMSMEVGENDGWYMKKAKWSAQNFILKWTNNFKIRPCSHYEAVDAEFDLEYFQYKNGSCWGHKPLHPNRAAGESCARAKFSNEDITKILLDASLGGKTITQIANEFGVQRQTISMIVNGHTYREVTEKSTKKDKLLASYSRSKLSYQDIIDIRNSNAPDAELAKRYKIKPRAIKEIKERKTFKLIA